MIKKIFYIIVSILIVFSCKKAGNPDIEKQSKFSDIENIDVKLLPDIAVPIFGVEIPDDVPDAEGKDMNFDELHNSLFVVNLGEPKEKLNITLKDPKNNTYSKELLNNKDRIYNTFTEDMMSGKKYKNPVIYIPFNNYSFLNSGEWEITVTMDNDENNRVTKKIKVEAEDITILPGELTNPVEALDVMRMYKAGDTVYIYGNIKEKNSEITVAVYNFTDKMNEKNEMITSPYTAAKIKTDNEGKFKILYKVGSEMPAGQYNIATGINEKELGVHLFTGAFQIQQ